MSILRGVLIICSEDDRNRLISQMRISKGCVFLKIVLQRSFFYIGCFSLSDEGDIFS